MLILSKCLLVFLLLIFIDISISSTLDNHLSHIPMNVPNRNSNYDYPEPTVANKNVLTKYTFYAPSTAEPAERPTFTPPQTQPPTNQPQHKINNNNNNNNDRYKSSPNYLRAPNSNAYEYTSPKSAVVSRKFSNDDPILTKAPQPQPQQTRAPQTQPPQTRSPQTQPPTTETPQTRSPQTQPPQTQPPQMQSRQSEQPTSMPKKSNTPNSSTQTPAFANSNTPTFTPKSM